MALLVVGGALNYIDRATLSVANKLIQDELGIPVAKMGLLLSAFLWTYPLAQLPVGGLIDPVWSTETPRAGTIQLVASASGRRSGHGFWSLHCGALRLGSRRSAAISRRSASGA